MPSPFPGMDPYLEGRAVWPDVHHNLISGLQTALAPQVAPAYYVAIEQRVTTVEIEREERVRQPDAAIVRTGAPPPPSGAVAVLQAPAATELTVAVPSYEKVREGYIEIRDVEHHVVVTAIELLSPTNKSPGEGCEQYEKKRREVLSSETNLVEIDLLRAGQPMTMNPLPQTHYRVLICRGWENPRAALFAFNLRQALPTVPVPLGQDEREAQVALGPLLAEVYDRARYDLRLDYRQPPEPPLSPEDVAWIEELLRAKGSRAAGNS